MNMFKRRNNRNLPSPHGMSADVYERNGIAQRPAADNPMNAIHYTRRGSNEDAIHYTRRGSNEVPFTTPNNAYVPNHRSGHHHTPLAPLRSVNPYGQSSATSSGTRGIDIDAQGTASPAVVTPVIPYVYDPQPRLPRDSTRRMNPLSQSQPNATAFRTRGIDPPAAGEVTFVTPLLNPPQNASNPRPGFPHTSTRSSNPLSQPNETAPTTRTRVIDAAAASGVTVVAPVNPPQNASNPRPGFPHTSTRPTNPLSQPNETASTTRTRVINAAAASGVTVVDPVNPPQNASNPRPGLHRDNARLRRRVIQTTTTVNNGPPTPSPRQKSGGRRLLCAINPFKKPSNANGIMKMRVFVQDHVQPGRLIRVLCPTNVILIATIPPRSDWIFENTPNGITQYFRVEFDPSVPSINQDLPSMPDLSSCTCVHSLGVFDTSCPCHGTTPHSNERDIPNSEQEMDDMISVAQEEGGNTTTVQPSDNGNRVHFDPFVPRVRQDLPSQQDLSSCTCNHSLGVFDTSCPCHGTPAHSNEWNIPNPEQEVDNISVTQEEGGNLTTVQPSYARNNSWECKACSLINDFQSEVCAACLRANHLYDRELQQTILNSVQS